MAPQEIPSQARVGDVIGASDWSDDETSTMRWLADLLKGEGVNLMEVSEAELKRGTPVFVDANARVEDVQRLMAQKHIRRLPVLKDGLLLSVVDLVDLAMASEG